jgi:hypothetical protein
MKNIISSIVDHFSYMKPFYIILALAVGPLSFLLVDSVFAKRSNDPMYGTVIERIYVPAGSSTTYVNGKVGTTTTSEKWIVVVQLADEVVSAKVTPEIWSKVGASSRVEVTQKLGRITGWVYGHQVL